MEYRRAVVGAAAPPIELLDTGGRPWRLTDHCGSIVVLVFHRHIH